MAESSLSLGYPDYLARLGRFLGYGASPTGDELTDCERIMDAGLRRFYGARKWGFLEITDTLTLTSGVASTDLPDDFGQLTAINFPTGSYNRRLEHVTIQSINEMNSVVYEYSGDMQYFAISPKATDQTTGQRLQITFWPTPNDDYAMVMKYRALPSYIRSATPYPLGGMDHAETIMEFILAQAEMELDDEAGNHEGRSKELLQQSIMIDVEQYSPKQLGYNQENSDSRFEPPGDHYRDHMTTRGFSYP